MTLSTVFEELDADYAAQAKDKAQEVMSSLTGRGDEEDQEDDDGGGGSREDRSVPAGRRAPRRG